MTAPASPSFAALAGRIPPLVRFGASSWNYPGWGGLVYHRAYEGKVVIRNKAAALNNIPIFDRSKLRQGPVPLRQVARVVTHKPPIEW